MARGDAGEHMVTLNYCCPKCGTLATALYDRGERQYGDLPRCWRKCDVPFAVMDAIAGWLDDRAMNGAGVPVNPTFADVCGYDVVER
jgi:hypothetical protein